MEIFLREQLELKKYCWASLKFKNIVFTCKKPNVTMPLKMRFFERMCKQEGMGIKMKYTAPSTSQQNGHVKWKRATLFSF